MQKFPVPVSGEEIPDGWHTDLVKFINSLVPRGDGVTVRVNHTPGGVTISAINQAGGGAGFGGGSAPELDHPFKVSLITVADSEGAPVRRIRVEGGPVIAYSFCVYSPWQEFEIGPGGYIYLLMTADQYNLDVVDLEVYYGEESLSYQEEYVPGRGYRYAFPIAEVEVSEEGTVTIRQKQFSTLVTPFTREYIPTIHESLAPLLFIDEAEIPYMQFKLQDREDLGAPREKDEVYLRQNEGKLEWSEFEGEAKVKIHESLSKLLEINDDGELALAQNPPNINGESRAGKVLAVNADDNAVEWITVAGGGNAALGVITSGGGSAGAATWQPVIVSSDGSYTIDSSAPAVSVIIPRF